MITVITGIPGMGKTSLLVSMLLEIEKAAERPIFVMGIPDLKIEHIPAPPVSEWTEMRADKDDPTLQLAYFTFPPNSILVVDECQRVFRPRSSGSKVPPEVAAMETHRHTGLDIILLTQKPKLIDTNIRELVGKHIHIRQGLLGRHLYEWPHIADGESRADREEAAKRRFKPPKHAFSKYKSAELHTKHSFRIHQAFYFLLIAVAAIVYLSYKNYSNYLARTAPKPQQEAKSVPDKRPTTPRSSAGASGAPVIAKASTVTQAAQVVHDAPVAGEHPFSGYKFILKGVVDRKGKRTAYFDIASSDGQVVSMDNLQLIEAGYQVEVLNPCLALIRFGMTGFTATCGEVPKQPAVPEFKSLQPPVTVAQSAV